jgi:amidophosphoribosyltransferase
MSEELSEACGVYGVISRAHEDVFPSLYWGLLSLNHRGQQSYGFTTLDNSVFHKREDLNLIPTDPREVRKLSNALRGRLGIANARYATSGGTRRRHLEGGKQPLVVSADGRRIAVSYNGNIVNAWELRSTLRKRLGSFRTDADTEVLAKQILLGLIEHSGDYERAIAEVLDIVEGAYSVLILDSDGSLHAFRDVNGIRPFCFARKNAMYAFSSETPALDINGFVDKDYINPGELISVGPGKGLRRAKLRKAKHALCAFEFAYFSRPDSVLNGTRKPVYKIREDFARELAKTYRKRLTKDNLIVSIPEAADDAAYGLHIATGLSWERAVRKNRYVTRRAFISSETERNNVIDKKVNVVSSLVKRKRIALIEDSIVRGDTSKINIDKLRAAGANSIDLFVTFPRITDPCLYGVDMATYGELLGSIRSPKEIANWLGADSVNYQTLEGLVNAIGISRENLCLACVTGKYPTPRAQELADGIKRKYRSHLSEERSRIYETS